MELQGYFNLLDYIDRLTLSPKVLEHLEETSNEFDKYFKTLASFDSTYVIYFWIDLLYKEILASGEIENAFTPVDFLENDMFISNFSMNNKRIGQLHSIFIPGETTYREREVKVSGIENGEEKIYWWGVKHEDVPQFMKDFITFYRTNGISPKYSSPFIKSFLVHLLFVRIHPYMDGNGRTARLLQNIKFTQLVNNLYGSNLRLSPLNLSPSINISKISYANRINDIAFKPDSDDNEAINRYLDFLLFMADEQLYNANYRLELYKPTLLSHSKYAEGVDLETEKQAQYMKLKRIFK